MLYLFNIFINKTNKDSFNMDKICQRFTATNPRLLIRKEDHFSQQKSNEERVLNLGQPKIQVQPLHRSTDNFMSGYMQKSDEWWLPVQPDPSDIFSFESFERKDNHDIELIESSAVYSKSNELKSQISIGQLEERQIFGQNIEVKQSLKKLSGFKKTQCARNISRSETKNISKNYGKALLKFIKEKPQLIDKMLISINSSSTHEDINNYIQTQNKSLNKISDIKGLWINHPFAIQLRAITDYFIRKHSFQWIYNSRIQDTQNHLKYRSRFREAVKKPDQFMHLKF